MSAPEKTHILLLNFKDKICSPEAKWKLIWACVREKAIKVVLRLYDQKKIKMGVSSWSLKWCQCWSCSSLAPCLWHLYPCSANPCPTFPLSSKTPMALGRAVLPELWGLFTFSITPKILHPISTPSQYGTNTLLVGSKQNSPEMFDIQLHPYTKLKERAHHGDKSPQ